VIYLVASELRAYLAREPFAALYRPISDRLKLASYRSLSTLEFAPESTFLLCSVCNFSPTQQTIAQQWESALSAHDGVRVLNRPSRIPPWPRQMQQIAEAGGDAAPVWPLIEQIARPRFPMMLRQQTSDFQVESPLITSQDDLNEILDRMVMAGADPREIWAVQVPDSDGHSGGSATTSLVKLGKAVFKFGGSVLPEDFARMKAIIDASPMDAAAFDFVTTKSGPCLWRIDADLGRILPNLLHTSNAHMPDQALMTAIVALDDRVDSSAKGSISLDPKSIEIALRK